MPEVFGPQVSLKRPAVSFDPRCYDLAALFLSDCADLNSDANRNKLAQVIQTTIEDWIVYEEGPCDLCGGARGKGDHSHPEHPF